MSVVDWSAKPEPWRSVGMRFVKDCKAIMAGEVVSPPERPALHRSLSEAASRRLSEIMIRRMNDPKYNPLAALNKPQRRLYKKLRRSGIAPNHALLEALRDKPEP